LNWPRMRSSCWSDAATTSRGAGEQILRSALERIRADRLPSYTETLEASNLPFYERLGFQVIAESDVPGSAAHVWSLVAEYRLMRWWYVTNPGIEGNQISLPCGSDSSRSRSCFD
jgi:hypothetical protein